MLFPNRRPPNWDNRDYRDYRADCDHRTRQKRRMSIGLTLALKVGMLLGAAWVYVDRAELADACRSDKHRHRASGLEHASAESAEAGEGLTQQPEMRARNRPEQFKMYVCPLGPGPFFLLQRGLHADAGQTPERCDGLAVCPAVARAASRLRADAAPGAGKPWVYLQNPVAHRDASRLHRAGLVDAFIRLLAQRAQRDLQRTLYLH